MGASLKANKRAGRGRGGRYSRNADINVTPMVDVMLVLLIVFMVAAPLLTSGIPVDLPHSEAKAIADEDNKPILITVAKDNTIYVGETVVEEGKIVPMLQAMTEAQGDEERRIYIRGDQTLSYGKVMSVLGLVNGAGFKKVALISERKR